MGLAINWGVDREKAPKVTGMGTCLYGVRETEAREGEGSSRVDLGWRQQTRGMVQQAVC